MKHLSSPFPLKKSLHGNKKLSLNKSKDTENCMLNNILSAHYTKKNVNLKN